MPTRLQFKDRKGYTARSPKQSNSVPGRLIDNKVIEQVSRRRAGSIGCT